MNQDFYQYSENMRSYLQFLEKRIKQLEAIVDTLTKDVALLQQKPTVHIDRIDYSFDQLKVETLEGTLNIGLNPDDLQKIEELTIHPKGPTDPNAAFYPPMDPKQMMNRSIDIEESLLQYIQSELPDFILTKQKELQIPEGETYVTFIQEDVTKQLPTRIQYYLQRSSKERGNGKDPLTNEEIINYLKQEMENGVHLFLSNIPENMKERKPE